MPERLAYSIAEAAEAIGISRDTVYRLIQRGEVHSVLVGKRRLVPRASLLELLGVATEEAEDQATASAPGAIPLAVLATSAPRPLSDEEEATFIVTVRRERRRAYACSQSGDGVISADTTHTLTCRQRPSVVVDNLSAAESIVRGLTKILSTSPSPSTT